MQLFYAPNITLPVHTLSEQESMHCIKVLRLGKGQSIHLTDGRGNLFLGRIENPHPKHCTVLITQTIERFEPLPCSLSVAVAPTKNIDRLEWFAEKATEIGITRIIPIECARSERRTLNSERLERVVVSAMKQSVKAYLPEVAPLTPLRELLTEPLDGTKLIAHCEPSEDKIPISRAIGKGDDVLILIGPEGDFSPEEITFALENGFRATTLGTQRLRTETAALYAVAAVSLLNQ